MAKDAASIRRTFWDPDRSFFADDPSHKRCSEHAQGLAILSNVFGSTLVDSCLESLLSDKALARTTVYFSFYTLEALYLRGRGDVVLTKLEFWKNMVAQGLRAPVEQPEPSRSDRHAWGSHPLFHMHASLCGIRPASAGFRSVRIAPQPGDLQHLKCRTPHPDGFIDFEMEKKGQLWNVSVQLPAGLAGVLEFCGVTVRLENSVDLEIPVDALVVPGGIRDTP